jgi:hypothetical protein
MGHCAGGTSDNSPALQRWGAMPGVICPEGMAEAQFCRPLRTHPYGTPIPNAEALGYSRTSLRDEGAPTTKDLCRYQCPYGRGEGTKALGAGSWEASATICRASGL